MQTKTKSAVRRSQVNPLITVLRLGGNRIGDQGAEALAEALATVQASVQALHLEGNQV